MIGDMQIIVHIDISHFQDKLSVQKAISRTGPLIVVADSSVAIYNPKAHTPVISLSRSAISSIFFPLNKPTRSSHIHQS